MINYYKTISISKSSFSLLLIIGFLFIVLFFITSDVNAQNRCKNALADAQAFYGVGRTLEMINVLTACLPDSIPMEQRAKAYEFLALAYIAEGLIEEAKDTINKLLDIEKNYRPDSSIHPAKFVELTQQAIDQRSKRNRLKKYFLYGGGGLAFAVTLKYIISKGEEQPNPLPTPPRLPDNR